ncbi:MAG: hypothetical protein Q9208_007064 [Pyrenodesmia sp. 3 TL-2023]
MSAVEANPPVSQESKTALKKKAKAKSAAKDVTVQPTIEAEGTKPNADHVTNGADGGYESPYIKELYKSIRNVKKKLNATQKVDSIVAENPDQTLDQLLAARKINQDQKAQAQKKPALQASLAQLEEQVAQYKQFDEEYQKRLATEKAALETSHKDELDKVKEAATLAAKAESAKEAKDNLLALSKFLRAAAAKRQGGDETSPENRAFEGALLLVYGGEAAAVAAMESLIVGSDEKVPTVDQVPSEYTYKQVHDLAFEYAPYAAEEAWAEDVAQSEPAPPPAEESSTTEVGTDPTLAHAGLTELDTPAEPTSNGVSHHVDTPGVPDASNIDAGAANAAASEPHWEAKQSASAESALRAGPKMSPLILNGTPARLKQLLRHPLVLTASTKCVGDEAHDLKAMVVDAVAEVTVVIVEAGLKADIVAVVVDIEVIAAEEREDIAGVAEVDGEIVAGAMLSHSELPVSPPCATAAICSDPDCTHSETRHN